MIVVIKHEYKDIICFKNLCEAWNEFVRGKKSKKDVAEFSLNLSQNIFNLHLDLKNKTYKHGSYKAFSINDPKPRNIHKATVRDRLLHHAVYRILYPYFDKKFIADSFSCRKNKGTHKAMERFKRFALKVSKNNTKTCFVLKCDIKKFFASIDQKVLFEVLRKHICDKDTLWLLQRIIESFNSGKKETGLPLGNLTSQLLVNVYMNDFDQFVKHKLKEKYYIRYADDFVILSDNKEYLQNLVLKIAGFLKTNLKLSLHPDKVFIKTCFSGVDFLGFVHFPNHRVLRTATKKRMFRKLARNNFKKESLESYKGMMKWGSCFKINQKLTCPPLPATGFRRWQAGN